MHSYPTVSSSNLKASNRGSLPPWRIALVANLKEMTRHNSEDPPDAGAEFDRMETIEAIGGALEVDGHWVHFLQAGPDLPQAIKNIRPHIVFNIAEGVGGDGREAHVPALCEMLQIPYTASRVVSNAISLDKTQTKHIWHDLGLPTATFREFTAVEQVSDEGLTYPLFVKPVREGTGMGINQGAIVHTFKELLERVSWVMKVYHQPALVEEFLPGREFTVGFIGNHGNPANRRRPELYDHDGYHFFPILEIDSGHSVTPGVYGVAAKSLNISEQGAPAYLCPANIPDDLREKMISLTKQAAQALHVSDVARIDFRLGADGKPYLMEINTLPGLNPFVSDLCIMASSERIVYQVLITEILYLAAERYQLSFSPASASWINNTLAEVEKTRLKKKIRVAVRN